jgi:hypothetical protein
MPTEKPSSLSASDEDAVRTTNTMRSTQKLLSSTLEESAAALGVLGSGQLCLISLQRNPVELLGAHIRAFNDIKRTWKEGRRFFGI